DHDAEHLDRRDRGAEADQLAVRASGLLTGGATTEERVIPEDLRYTAGHEGVSGCGGGPVRVGITHYAQDALGDIVFVQLPDEGTTVQAGESLGEIESTKSASEIYAPVGGGAAGEHARQPQQT